MAQCGCNLPTIGAMDAWGNAAELQYIDFVKVQCGVNAKSGHLGELSTEVFSVVDYKMVF